MNLNQWKYVLIVIFLSVFFFVIILPIMSDNISRIEDKFLTIALLNESGNIGNYFSNEEFNVNINESINWNIYLYNHMGELKYVSIRIKIVSDINDLPNISLCSPSLMSEIFEIRRFISDNQTILVPLTWSITDANDSGVGLAISKMNINGHEVDVNLADKFDKRVSIVIELWVWDNEINDFTFHWISNRENRCSWNHMSFTNKFTPVVSAPIPSDGATEVPLATTRLFFTLIDPNKDRMDYYISTLPDVGSDSAIGVSSGNFNLIISGLELGTEYHWWVNATDGTHWQNLTYSFATQRARASDPPNGATDVQISITQLNFSLSDPKGEAMDYYVSTEPDIGSRNDTGVSNGDFNLTVSGLTYNTEYLWWVNVTNGFYWTNASFTFTTEPNPPPKIESTEPSDEKTDVLVSTTLLNFTLSDKYGDLMNYSVSTLPDVGSDSAIDVSDGDFSLTVSGLAYDTEYTWWVNVTDGFSWTNASYTFTTEQLNLAPVISDPEPIDEATNVPLTTTLLNFTLTDPNGDFMNYSVSTIPDVGFNIATNVSNGTFNLMVSELTYNTTYIWWVNVTDGTSWTNNSYTFTTENPLSFVSARTQNSTILAFKTMMLNFKFNDEYSEGYYLSSVSDISSENLVGLSDGVFNLIVFTRDV